MKKEQSNPQWKVLETHEIFSTGMIRFRVDKCELSNGRVMPRYYVLEFSDWVQVIPITKQKTVILVDQYRHAAAGRFLEVPGGSTNPRKAEEPELAARRELLEETGYTAGSVELIRSHYPNPALLNNRIHTFIAYDCVWTQEPNLDPYEDLTVVEMPVRELVQKIEKGEIQHSLVLASLLLALPRLKNLA